MTLQQRFHHKLGLGFLMISSCLVGCSEKPPVRPVRPAIDEPILDTTPMPDSAKQGSNQASAVEGATESTATNTASPTTDALKTEGTWKMKSASMAGNPFPDALTDTISLTIEGEKYLVMVGDQPDKGTCKVDPSTTPMQMTIVGTEGPNAGKTMLAIFEMPDPSTLRVSYDLKGVAFPTSFESTKENGYYSAIYVRQE